MLNGPGNQSLPYSEACDRNKAPILHVLQQHLPEQGAVLEIGSGTGQHAVYFAAHFPRLRWQPSDTGDFLHGLRARIAAEAADNVLEVLELDVRQQHPQLPAYAAVFTANTLHFMSAAAGSELFRLAGRVLQPGGKLVVYGPFRYAGDYTSPSNARFDAWLKSTDTERGVRDFEWAAERARLSGLHLVVDVAMPANNQCLVWRKTTAD